MFGRRKHRDQTQAPWSDKAAGRISIFLLSVQKKLSDAVNQRLSLLSAKSIKILLVGFCLVWGGLSVLLIARAVLGWKHRAFKIEHVRLIQPLDEMDGFTGDAEVDLEIYDQIQHYKSYMDSTRQPIRSGLMDSMNLLEQIYLSKQKNEANEK